MPKIQSSCAGAGYRGPGQQQRSRSSGADPAAGCFGARARGGCQAPSGRPALVPGPELLQRRRLSCRRSPRVPAENTAATRANRDRPDPQLKVSPRQKPPAISPWAASCKGDDVSLQADVGAEGPAGDRPGPRADSSADDPIGDRPGPQLRAAARSGLPAAVAGPGR